MVARPETLPSWQYSNWHLFENVTPVTSLDRRYVILTVSTVCSATTARDPNRRHCRSCINIRTAYPGKTLPLASFLWSILLKVLQKWQVRGKACNATNSISRPVSCINIGARLSAVHNTSYIDRVGLFRTTDSIFMEIL